MIERGVHGSADGCIIAGPAAAAESTAPRAISEKTVLCGKPLAVLDQTGGHHAMICFFQETNVIPAAVNPT